MSAKSEKARGAEVRASRAKSRVESRKRSREAARKAKRPSTPRKPASRKCDRGEGTRTETATSTVVSLAEEKKPRRASRHKRNLEAPVRQVKPAKAEHVAKTPAPEETAGKSGGGASAMRIAVLGALLVVSLAALLWIYTGTGVLNVKQVEIEGNEVLGTDYLRSLSGITGDTHLLKMDVKAVEKALQSEPYIASVDISRRFPNTVVIEVSERRPSGAILQNGRYCIVDQEGMVLESEDAIPPGLVEIKQLQLPLLLPGTEISGIEFASVSSLLGSLPSALREKTAVVGLSDARGLYLEAGGTVVIYGEARDLSRKNVIALMALNTLVERYGAVDYIDVSFPDHPVIKPLGAV
jgi:cell division protein FtsQ